MRAPPFSLFPQLDTECRSLVELGVFHIDASLVVALDDALGQGETESPTAFLSGEARGEDTAEMALLNTLAGVLDIDLDTLIGLRHVDVNPALAIHGIDGILAEVLDNPLEERATHAHHDGTLGLVKLDHDML